jgi:hypothetical protein
MLRLQFQEVLDMEIINYPWHQVRKECFEHQEENGRYFLMLRLDRYGDSVLGKTSVICPPSLIKLIKVTFSFCFQTFLRYLISFVEEVYRLGHYRYPTLDLESLEEVWEEGWEVVRQGNDDSDIRLHPNSVVCPQALINAIKVC